MFQEDGTSSVTSSSPMLPTMTSPSPPGAAVSPPYTLLKELKPEERGLYLIHLLVSCANHVENGNFAGANSALDQISHLSSPAGDTMQRIASYFSEALADRILRTWPGVYRAFKATQISALAEEALVRKMFAEFLPFLKVAFVITNQAIIEAMEGEKMVHVIDLNGSDPTQWCGLIRDLSARPEGPPHLRITAIHRQKEALEQMAHILTKEAEKLDLPFQFNAVVGRLENLDADKLRVKTGEALAISSILQLHTLLASDNNEDVRKGSSSSSNNCSPSTDSPSSSPLSPPNQPSNLDVFLSGLRALNPKVMVLTEQDSDHNRGSLMERLSESLYFYAALFDCFESALPRASLERVKMEKMILGEEIKDVIACEGSERKQRHERMEKWRQRMGARGFAKVPLSYYAMLQAKRLLIQGCNNCDGYKLREDDGCVAICWHDRRLFGVSAWRFKRSASHG